LSIKIVAFFLSTQEREDSGSIHFRYWALQSATQTKKVVSVCFLSPFGHRRGECIHFVCTGVKEKKTKSIDANRIPREACFRAN